uniref:CoA transferase n=1 Tax=Streptomyces bohaiensis TaxID=1431344 RepID=UPI0030C75370
MIHPVVQGFAPLAGQQCTVTGTGTVARVAADHLRRLGAAVRADRADRAAVGGAAAEGTGPPPAARLRAAGSTGPAGPSGAAEVLVRWADALPTELVHDETSAQAVCGLMHVHGRRHGRPRALRVDVAATAAAVLATTALLARLHADEPPGERHPALSTGVDRAALTLAAHHLAVGGSDGGPPAAAPGGPPFRSAEGTWFEIEALAAEGWAAFWAALGAPREAARDGWRSFADRFTTAVAPLPRALHAATRRHRWAQLRGRADRCGVSVCAVAAAAPGPPSDPWLLRTGPPPAPPLRPAARGRPPARPRRPVAGGRAR